jgi:hypothetical protein
VDKLPRTSATVYRQRSSVDLDDLEAVGALQKLRDLAEARKPLPYVIR